MKSDTTRVGRFSIDDHALIDPASLLWVFEGLVVKNVRFEYDTYRAEYCAWSMQFDRLANGERIPEYEARRVDGRTEWRRKP